MKNETFRALGAEDLMELLMEMGMVDEVEEDHGDPLHGRRSEGSDVSQKIC